MTDKRVKIGVTGSAGSGKSLVCKQFEARGAAVLDCDLIARQVVEPGQKGLESLVKQYGPDILLPDHSLDRKALRQILIQDPKKQKEIEAILHPLIREEMNRQMKTAFQQGKTMVVVEVPLLFESDMDGLFDLTIAVVADEQQLVDRITSRDTVSEKDARRLLDLQMPQNQKAGRADITIYNDQTCSQLAELVDKLFDKIEKEFLTN